MKSIITYLLVFFVISTNLYSQQSQFSLELLGGPVFYNFDNTNHVSYSQQFNYTIGLYIKKNISFKKNIISIQTGYFVDTKSYEISFTDSINYSSKKRNDSFVYGNIPLIVEYSRNLHNRFYPFISAGFIFGHILKEERQTTQNDGSVKEGFPFDSENLMNPKDVYVSIGLNYRLNKEFLLRFEPFLTYQINDSGYNNQDIYGMLAYGIKLGIQFDFAFRETNK